MFIKQTILRNFRNYKDSSFDFNQEGSLIVGQNGIGKTNLLEAISFFTYGKSILNHADSKLTHYNSDNYFIKSLFITDIQYEYKVYYDLDKKIIHIDNNPLKKLSDLYQHLQVVYSGPDDIFNIFSVPAKRRFFLDMSIAKIFPIYLDFLRKYKNTLIQRNALLKKDFVQREKDHWDKTFADDAKNVIEYRQKFFVLFKDNFIKAYSMITKDIEEVDIFLKLSFYDADFTNKFLILLRENQNKEIKYLSSLYGPHLDDFYITINQKNALHFASQGQKRSIVLALKIAMAGMITDITRIKPIMIFDDTLAELDKQRCENLLTHLIGHHQVFIATPSIEKYLESKLPILSL